MISLVSVAALLFAYQASAFNLVAGHSRALTRPHLVLHASSLSVHQDELTSKYLLNKARECAFSDYSSAVEAKLYLTKILEIESGCVSGMLAGHDLCDNVDELADIVAHLRQKVSRTSLVPLTTTAVSIPLSLAFMSVLIVLASTIDYGQDATPFTINEWIWAAKGGYVSLRALESPGNFMQLILTRFIRLALCSCPRWFRICFGMGACKRNQMYPHKLLQSLRIAI
jgi:hypothetical protein